MTPRRFAVLALLVFAAGCGAGDGETGLAPGAAAPEPWSAGPERVVVGWAVRPEQLVTCETAAHQLRVLRARFGSAVSLSMVTVDSEPALVRSFLRAQRLPELPVTFLNDDEYGITFGARAEPALFVVRAGRVQERLSADRAALLDQPGARRLELLVDSLIAAGPEAPPRSTSIPGG